jgi:hypothetical protein
VYMGFCTHVLVCMCMCVCVCVCMCVYVCTKPMNMIAGYFDAFIERGWVDFAVFDAERTTELVLKVCCLTHSLARTHVHMSLTRTSRTLQILKKKLSKTLSNVSNLRSRSRSTHKSLSALAKFTIRWCVSVPMSLTPYSRLVSLTRRVSVREGLAT